MQNRAQCTDIIDEDFEITPEMDNELRNEDFPEYVLFGNEVKKFDVSMLRWGLCPECTKLGYCKMKEV